MLVARPHVKARSLEYGKYNPLGRQLSELHSAVVLDLETGMEIVNSVEDSPFVLDRTRQVAPQLISYLRKKILSLELEPGTELSRLALQEQFNLSQTPVRDAMMQLRDEGLITIYPQAGTVVSKIDLNLARQAHILRISIELEAARQLAHEQVPHNIAFLHASIAKQELLLSPDNYDEFSAADDEFHRLIFLNAKLPDLWPVVTRQSGHMFRLRRLHLPDPGKAQAIVEQHKNIVDAIGSGNPDKAVKTMRIHHTGTLEMADEIKQRYPTFFE